MCQTYCKTRACMVQYTSLMCDETGGCGIHAGNFRGVCPINGRQRILNRSAWMRFRGVPSSRCVSVAAKRQNLFLPRYSGVLGIILKTSVAEPSVFSTERPCNMCRRSFADFWRKNGMLPEFPSVWGRIGFFIREDKETPGCVFRLHCAAFKTVPAF